MSPHISSCKDIQLNWTDMNENHYGNTMHSMLELEFLLCFVNKVIIWLQAVVITAAHYNKGRWQRLFYFLFIVPTITVSWLLGDTTLPQPKHVTNALWQLLLFVQGPLCLPIAHCVHTLGNLSGFCLDFVRMHVNLSSAIYRHPVYFP